MSEIHFSQSLRARIMAFTGTLFLVLTILIVTSILFFVYKTEQNTWRARQSEAAENAAIKVTDYLMQNETLLQWLDKYEFDEIRANPNILREILKDNPAFMEFAFVDEGGNPVVDAAQDQPILANQFTILQSEWFRVANSGQKIYTRVQTSPENESYIIVAMPSRHGGVLAAQIHMDVLWETVAQIHFGETGKIYVVNQSGQLIAHPNRQIVLSNQNIGDTALFKAILEAPGRIWIGDAVNFDGDKVVSVSAPVELTNWIVISELPQKEAYATSRLASTLIPIVVILLMAVIILIFREMLDRLILQPLNLLRDGADRVGRGDLSHRIGLAQKDEIGQLASAFDAMAADLEKQQDNLQKAIAYEYEIKRANELARSNAMILALSKVAAMLENSSNSELILDTLGLEMQKLDLSCAVVTIDSSQEAAVIEYISFNNDVIQKVEKLTGISLKGYVIPKRFWPGERIFTDKAPIWYPQPRQIIRRMFPAFPDFIANQAWKFSGIQPEGQLCILPLLVDDKVVGAMPVWGSSLMPADNPILAIFASQVAGILQKAAAFEDETKRANELARSNSMILALSKVAAQLESSSDPIEIYETVGKELKRIGIDSMIGLLNEDKQSIQIQYASIRREVIHWAEKTTGHPLSQLTIPRNFWPTEKVVTEKAPYWDPNLMKGTLNMFPILPERLHKTVMKMAGINLDDPVCYLPLANEQDVLGVLAVWGAGLNQNDVSALSILANQVATAIRNSQLYEIEIRRGQEKEVLLKEIHHRVKNNLQIISSLLNLQSGRVTDFQTIQALRDSQSRVRSMALIHEKLYQSHSLAKIEFGDYVKSLANDLFRSYRQSFTGVQLNVQTDEVFLELDQAIPCGLILNELITNALKYAFPDGRNGTIKVELRASSEHNVSLRITDDGVGIPLDFDILNAKSLGLQLVNSLVAQLDGRLELGNSQGTDYLILFRC